MTKKQELEKAIDDARLKLVAIETKEKIDKNKNLIGKCFKYKNFYSYPNDDEYWWLYAKILSLDEYGSMSGIAFQTDINSKIEIEKRTFFSDFSGYTEIPNKEFYNAWDKLVISIDDVGRTLA